MLKSRRESQRPSCRTKNPFGMPQDVRGALYWLVLLATWMQHRALHDLMLEQLC